MKKKKLTIAALLVGGAILACQSSFAQSFVYNDLYLGFWNPSGTASADYIINLGAASDIVGGTSVVNLTPDFSLSDFDAVLGSSSNLVGGVVGAANLGTQSSVSDTFGTEFRVGGAGNPAVAGSSGNSTPFDYTADSGVVSVLGGLNAPAAGSGIMDTNKTWESQVESGLQVAHTYWSATGINPDSPIGGGGVLYEDLWGTSTSSAKSSAPWNYLGYFTLDLSGNPSLTFTPQAVPEPTSLSLLGGAGLLLLTFRRRLSGKNA